MNHATSAVTPPDRNWSGLVTPSGSGRSGAACLKARCGRCVLQESSYSRGTIIRCRRFQAGVRPGSCQSSVP
jgi:hypothetical protein